ncbi:MAG: 50S ribosomal protein L29 [Thermodesulfovibrionales bacterium]|nr:50S ribosomal protein L29 [Thermodesulfovibrionales bacterium]
MKPSELRALTVEDLKQKEQDTRKELFNLKFRLATGEVENPKRINALRKDIAKILTITTEKSPHQAGSPEAKKVKS